MLPIFWTRLDGGIHQTLSDACLISALEEGSGRRDYDLGRFFPITHIKEKKVVWLCQGMITSNHWSGIREWNTGLDYWTESLRVWFCKFEWSAYKLYTR